MTGVQMVGMLAAAVAIDRLWGELPPPLHPVVWIGKIARRCVRGRRRRRPGYKLVFRLALALAIPLAFAVAAAATLAAARGTPIAMFAMGSVLLSSTFAIRALRRAAHQVGDAIARGDLAGACRGLPSLCSRDPSRLTAPELAGSAVSSVAENASDSVVAPLFYFALFGVPGAMCYRAVNTLDAVVGYRGELEHVGKASARLDDILNWIPARITAALIVVAGGAVGGNARSGVRVWRRDGGRTTSPNAGRPMAAMAGVLGVELAKPGCYRLGDPSPPATVETVRRACRVLEGVAAGAIVGAAAFAWRLHHA